MKRYARYSQYGRVGLIAALGLVAFAGCGPSLTPVVIAPAPSGSVDEKKPPTPAQQAIAEGFVALGQTRGVTLFRRDVDKGLEFAMEGVLPASPTRVRRALLDYPEHTKWQPNLAECTVIGKGDDWADVYERLSLPLLDDRDFTLHVTWGGEGDVLWSKFVLANDKGPPPKDGVVRVALHEGAWTFTPEGDATRIFYRFHLDIDSSMMSMGAGQAESGLVDFFYDIQKELPNYP